MSLQAIARVARTDLAGYWRDRTVAVLLASVLALACLCLALAGVDYVETRRDKREAQRLAREAWVTQGEKNPHAAGHFGTFVFKPLQPLAIIDRGLDSYLGQRVRLETHAQHEAAARPVEDAPSLLRFGQLTPGFLLLYLGPLLVIVLTFGAISREREQGTLSMLLAQGIRPGTLLGGKILAASVVVPVLALPLLAFLVLAPAIGTPLTPELMARVAVMILAYGVYLLTFVLLGIGASGWFRSSTLSLILLLTLWIYSGTVAPRLTVLLAESRVPTPSSFAFLTAYEAAMGNKFVYGYGGYETFNVVYSRVERELMQQYGVTRAADLPVNPFGAAIEATEEEGQRAYDRTFGRVTEAFARQNDLHRVAAPASPFVSARFLFMGLTGTGLEEHLNFVTQAEEHRRLVMRTLNDDVTYNSRDPNYNVTLRNGAEYLRGRDFWASIPDFSYQALPLGAVLRAHVSDFLGLGVWLMIAAGLAWTGVRRACLTP
jgi:ABC-2 type transport system permease protein